MIGPIARFRAAPLKGQRSKVNRQQSPGTDQPKRNASQKSKVKSQQSKVNSQKSKVGPSATPVKGQQSTVKSLLASLLPPRIYNVLYFPARCRFHQLEGIGATVRYFSVDVKNVGRPYAGQ